jgi:hypothetical protein
MFDDVMIEFRFKTAIAVMVVGVHVGTNRHVVFDDLFQIVAGDVAHDLAANTSAAFKQYDNRRFIIFSPASNALLFSANVSFVNLDRARKFVFENWVTQRMADAISVPEGKNVTQAVATSEGTETHKTIKNAGDSLGLTPLVTGIELERAKGFEPSTLTLAT